MESKTPRTNEIFLDLQKQNYGHASFEVATKEVKQLETELAELRAALNALADNVGAALMLPCIDFAAGETVEEREHAVWTTVRRIIKELAEARAEIERLNADYAAFSDKSKAVCIDYAGQIERKDKLIEQMRTALKMALKADPCPAKDYWQTVETEHHRGECWHAKAQAALSAAEKR